MNCLFELYFLHSVHVEIFRTFQLNHFEWLLNSIFKKDTKDSSLHLINQYHSKNGLGFLFIMYMYVCSTIYLILVLCKMYTTNLCSKINNLRKLLLVKIGRLSKIAILRYLFEQILKHFSRQYHQPLFSESCTSYHFYKSFIFINKLLVFEHSCGGYFYILYYRSKVFVQ